MRKVVPIPRFMWAGIAVIIALSCACAQSHPFRVRDSIALTTFNEPSELLHDAKPLFSPDGKHFLIVTSRGIVETDQIESTLWIYSTRAVRSFVRSGSTSHGLRPRRLASAAGCPVGSTFDSYGALITDPRWAANSQHVYFLRQNARGDRQLYEVDAGGGSSHRITPFGYDVPRYTVAAGTSVAMITRPIRNEGRTARFFGDEINQNARDMTGLSLSSILFSHPLGLAQQLRNTQLWVTRVGTTGHVIQGNDSSFTDFGIVDKLSLSPTGRWLARLVPVTSMPSNWARYEPNPMFPYVRVQPRDPYRISPTNLLRLKSYAVIDVRSGKEVFRVAAPNARGLGVGSVDKAVWSHDETRLLLTNTYLPLEDGIEEQHQQRLRPCVVLDIEFSSKAFHCIVFSQFPKSGTQPPWLLDVSFGASKDEVILRYSGSSVERYQLNDDQWIREKPAEQYPSERSSRSKADRAKGGLQVTIRQSLNSSPALWAADQASGKSRQLWNPNPQLSQMKLGEASVYRWKDGNGIEWTGGLIKPVDYDPGKRYPLVIQTHGFSDGIFKDVTDGAYPTAMAARPLASAGIMVLQIPDYKGKEVATSAEAELYVEGYRSAIAHLTSEGLIDPKRVGIIGFSRTCWHVETALIEFPALFAAATIADGVDESYMQYHLFSEDSAHRSEFERINGAKPTGEGLKKWLEHAPGFRLDTVETPLRIEAIGQNSVLVEWEIYSSLRVRNVPVDLIYNPRGQHILQRPLDRMASQQGNVDWFEFWLQGHKADRPDQASEYRRWQAMGGSTSDSK